MIKELKNLNFTQVSKNNENILHFACRSTNKTAIENILEINENLLKNQININLKDSEKGWTPLYYLMDSSDFGEPELVQLLVKAGAHINIKDDKGITPLHLAAFKGQDEIINILLNYNNIDGISEEMKLDINAKDILGRVPLVLAIIEGQLNSALILLDAKADINVTDNENNSLLHYAVSGKGNSLLFSIMLIDRKIDLNAQNNDGNTALMLIAMKNPKENVRLMKKLLNSGAKYKGLINRRGQSFLSLMGEAAIKNNFVHEKINVEKENKEAFDENMMKYIQNKSNKKKNNDEIECYFFIIPVLILIFSFIVSYFM